MKQVAKKGGLIVFISDTQMIQKEDDGIIQIQIKNNILCNWT